MAGTIGITATTAIVITARTIEATVTLGAARCLSWVKLRRGSVRAYVFRLAPKLGHCSMRWHVSNVPGTEVATTFMCMHYRLPRCVDDRSRSIRQAPIVGAV